MTDHPCKGMTKPQIAAFERIAINQNAWAAERTIKKLLERGVIVRVDDKIFPSALGPIHVKQYAVPSSVHMQWCQWCEENAESSQ